MSTLRQIEATRRDAQESTGPTSVTGKAVSSMNSLKTSIYAKSLVLPYEKLADLEQFIEEYYQRFQPASPEARSRDPEKYPLGKSATYNPNSFSKLQYRVDATRRGRLRALQALEKSKAEAAPAPAPVVEPPDPPSLPPSPQTTSPQIGFVPATPIPAPAQPAPRSPQPRPQRAGTCRYTVRSNSSDWRALRRFPTSTSRTPQKPVPTLHTCSLLHSLLIASKIRYYNGLPSLAPQLYL